MNTIDPCWLCEEPIAANNAAKEHIIPNSIGGRRTVQNFLCRACNTRTGHNWDNRLAMHLGYLGLLFETRRQRGSVPSMKAPTASGDLVEILAGNRPALGKPTYKVTRDKAGGGFSLMRGHGGKPAECSKVSGGNTRKST